MKKLMLAAIAALLVTQAAVAAEFEVDVSHSQVGFSVKHLVISNVKGSFQKFTGKFTFDEKKKVFTAGEAVIEAKTIFTNDEKRDEHLRSGDFFDVEKHPEIKFVLKSGRVSGNNVQVVGDLTIRGITKTVVLNGQYLGAAKDPWGNERVGFTATGKINRKDFGLTWNKALETGGAVVGDEVILTIELEGIKKK